MPLRVREGNFVTNRAVKGTRYKTEKKKRESQTACSAERKTNHLLVAPDGTRASSPNFLVSFSHNPSKLPLDITSKRSPGSASAASTPAISSLLSKTRASFP